jgi:hypothetical protein
MFFMKNGLIGTLLPRAVRLVLSLGAFSDLVTCAIPCDSTRVRSRNLAAPSQGEMEVRHPHGCDELE